MSNSHNQRTQAGNSSSCWLSIFPSSILYVTTSRTRTSFSGQGSGIWQIAGHALVQIWLVKLWAGTGQTHRRVIKRRCRVWKSKARSGSGNSAVAYSQGSMYNACVMLHFLFIQSFPRRKLSNRQHLRSCVWSGIQIHSCLILKPGFLCIRSHLRWHWLCGSEWTVFTVKEQKNCDWEGRKKGETDKTLYSPQILPFLDGRANIKDASNMATWANIIFSYDILLVANKAEGHSRIA